VEALAVARSPWLRLTRLTR